MTKGGGQRRKVSQGKTRSHLQLRIYCEGEATESNYLTHWFRKHRDTVVISIADHKATTPMQLVQRASAEKRDDLREQRKGKGDAFDEYWCVFDVDEHPYLAEALQTAEANGINVAVSNPCLELWFVLHFQDQLKWIDRKVVQHCCFDHINCRKRLTPQALNLLDQKFDDARNRALALEEKHRGDNTAPPANPSTGMWRLIDKIRGYDSANPPKL